MNAHTLYRALRRVMPDAVAQPIRSVATAVLTPIRFSVASGHFRSSLARAALDRRGRPLPWYTYPMIEFLRDKDLKAHTILEFGAGQSTLWWASHARSVVSFEADPTWYERVKAQVPANVELHFAQIDLTGVASKVGGRSFDIVIVDGLDRFKASEMALACLAPNGAVILDNADGHWGPDVSYPIMDLYRARGFSRVDFYGHAPGVLVPHCTSLFFQGDCALLAGTENPRRPQS